MNLPVLCPPEWRAGQEDLDGFNAVSCFAIEVIRARRAVPWRHLSCEAVSSWVQGQNVESWGEVRVGKDIREQVNHREALGWKDQQNRVGRVQSDRCANVIGDNRLGDSAKRLMVGRGKQVVKLHLVCFTQVLFGLQWRVREGQKWSATHAPGKPSRFQSRLLTSGRLTNGMVSIAGTSGLEERGRKPFRGAFHSKPLYHGSLPTPRRRRHRRRNGIAWRTDRGCWSARRLCIRSSFAGSEPRRHFDKLFACRMMKLNQSKREWGPFSTAMCAHGCLAELSPGLAQRSAACTLRELRAHARRSGTCDWILTRSGHRHRAREGEGLREVETLADCSRCTCVGLFFAHEGLAALAVKRSSLLQHRLRLRVDSLIAGGAAVGRPLTSSDCIPSRRLHLQLGAVRLLSAHSSYQGFTVHSDKGEGVGKGRSRAKLGVTRRFPRVRPAARPAAVVHRISFFVAPRPLRGKGKGIGHFWRTRLAVYASS